MADDPGTPQNDPGAVGVPPARTVSAGSAWTALVRVLAEPGAVFQQLKERPAWLPPVLFYTLVQIGVGLLVVPAARATALQAIQGRSDIPEEAVELSLRMAAYTTPIGAVIGLLVAFLVVPLVLLLVRSLLGGEGRYGQLFSVYAYAYLPLALGSLLTGMLAWFNPEVPLQAQTISPAMFMPVEQSTTALYTFLGRLSPFGIWSWILVMIGFATVTEVPSSKVYWTLGVLWLAWSAIISFAGTLFGGLGGAA